MDDAFPWTADHRRFMEEALRLVCENTWKDGDPFPDCPSKAEHALNNDETPVGCVFVYEDRIIGRGFNDTNKSRNVRELPQRAVLSQRTLHRDLFVLMFSTKRVRDMQNCRRLPRY